MIRTRSILFAVAGWCAIVLAALVTLSSLTDPKETPTVSTTRIDEIAAFVRARYDEETTAAQAAYDRPSGYTVTGTPETEDHFALWRPLKVIDDVAAKRAALMFAVKDGNEPLVRALASPYNEHPDYRPEWTP